MVFPLPAVIGAAGALGAGALSFFGQKSANRANIASARESMDWQERMSNSSYQRSMDDMRRAGLNPILAAKLGGAGVGSGATAQSQNELGGAVSSAMEFKRLKADLENLREMNEKIKAETHSTRQDVWNRYITAASQVATNSASQLKMMAETENIKYDSALKALESKLYGSDFGSVLRVLEKIPGVGGALSGLFKKAPNITKVYK